MSEARERSLLRIEEMLRDQFLRNPHLSPEDMRTDFLEADKGIFDPMTKVLNARDKLLGHDYELEKARERGEPPPAPEKPASPIADEPPAKSAAPVGLASHPRVAPLVATVDGLADSVAAYAAAFNKPVKIDTSSVDIDAFPSTTDDEDVGAVVDELLPRFRELAKELAICEIHAERTGQGVPPGAQSGAELMGEVEWENFKDSVRETGDPRLDELDAITSKGKPPVDFGSAKPTKPPPPKGDGPSKGQNKRIANSSMTDGTNIDDHTSLGPHYDKLA